MIRRKFISKGIGALDSSAWSSIVQCVDAFENKSYVPDESPYSSSSRIIMIKITGSLIIANGTARWDYGWTQARQTNATIFGDDTTVTNPSITSSTVGYGQAKNLLEAGNVPLIAYGLAVTNLEIDSAPGFFIDPVPVNTFHLMTMMRDVTGVLRFIFSAPNPITGGCVIEGGLAGGIDIDGGAY